MAGALGGIIQRLRRAVSPHGGLDDAQLLERWVGARDEAAFEVLVWRHSGMVLSACRRLLRSEHDAEDAFQATFLVLARKAGSISNGAALGGWLHKVACRVAAEARGRSARQTAPLMIPDDLPASHTPDPDWSDVRSVLDEEIDQLPDKYRVPFVLCYLEGKTTDEAAACIGCPRGTVSTRLAWARDRLRQRLTRRGLAPSALAVGAGTLIVVPAQAASSTPLLLATVQAASQYAAGQSLASTSGGAALAHAVVQGMWAAKAKVVAAWVTSMALLFGSAGVAAHWAFGPFRGVPSTEQAEERSGVVVGEPPHVEATVLAVSADAQWLTLGSLEKSGRALPGTNTIRLTDEIEVIYSRVEAGGARPVRGYRAQVWLADRAKGIAGRVHLRGDAPGGGQGSPDATGRVLTVAADGGSFTLEVSAENSATVKQVNVRLIARTQVTYDGVGPSGARPTVGYAVQVWSERGSRGSAVVFSTPSSKAPRAERKDR